MRGTAAEEHFLAQISLQNSALICIKLGRSLPETRQQFLLLLIPLKVYFCRCKTVTLEVVVKRRHHGRQGHLYTWEWDDTACEVVKQL